MGIQNSSSQNFSSHNYFTLLKINKDFTELWFIEVIPIYQWIFKTDKLKNIYWFVYLKIIRPCILTLETYFMKNNCISQNKQTKNGGKSELFYFLDVSLIVGLIADS